jgi:hypothetical protein
MRSNIFSTKAVNPPDQEREHHATSSARCRRALRHFGRSSRHGPAGQPRTAISEIVVTAQKRSENVQNVPISISAFTAAALKERWVTSVASLSALAPNVNLDGGPPFSGSSAVLSATIRGIGSDDFAFNIDSGKLFKGSFDATTGSFNMVKLRATVGAPLPKTANWKINLSPRYEMKLASGASVVVLGDWTHATQVWNNIARTLLLRRPTNDLFNGNITYNAPMRNTR